ncbi:hypothetical protein J6590_086910 [Homalodisca vitripennis]|nr:hypothetical protein J6590_086910 [Homalodisca vitripennis]
MAVTFEAINYTDSLHIYYYFASHSSQSARHKKSSLRVTWTSDQCASMDTQLITSLEVLDPDVKYLWVELMLAETKARKRSRSMDNDLLAEVALTEGYQHQWDGPRTSQQLAELMYQMTHLCCKLSCV